jgi:hypothetical protein
MVMPHSQTTWPDGSRGPQTLVTRRAAIARPPVGDVWDLNDAWFERPRLSAVGATIDRSRPPPKRQSHGLRFALVSLGLIGASIAATAFLVAPHAKEITSVPATRVPGPIHLAQPHGGPRCDGRPRTSRTTRTARTTSRARHPTTRSGSSSPSCSRSCTRTRPSASRPRACHPPGRRGPGTCPPFASATGRARRTPGARSVRHARRERAAHGNRTDSADGGHHAPAEPSDPPCNAGDDAQSPRRPLSLSALARSPNSQP